MADKVELPEISEDLKGEFHWAVLHFIGGWIEQPNMTFNGRTIGQTFELVTNFGGSLKNDPVAYPLFDYFQGRCPDLQLELAKDETYPTAARCMLIALDRRSKPPKP